MAEQRRWYQTAAIDYPNSRPHIGTAFEKLGADVQARYRRMEGYAVTFLMGNDENTLKVADRAKELGLDPQVYCDDMARQFREVWDALDISYDVFIQTSHERHKACCRAFVQKVYDNGDIYKDCYEGWYCPGCEEFKSLKVYAESKGQCPNHGRQLVRRSEPCYYFRLSKYQKKLLAHLEDKEKKEKDKSVQPESRRNEMIGFIEAEELQDLNISRHGEDWGIRLPFDPEFTIYVWFDALLTYITGIGYGDDPATFSAQWPANIHFIGKDITRFHTHIWPAMLWAAGEKAPDQVFSHGWVTVDGTKMGKSMGNVKDPLEIVAKSSVDAYRYYFLRECPYTGDGDYSGERYEQVCDGDLAKNLGNLVSRVLTLISKNYDGTLPCTAGRAPTPIEGTDFASTVEIVRGHVTTCRYDRALEAIWRQILDPANQYADKRAPWKLVKSDLKAAAQVLFDLLEPLRAAAILLKPFLPRSAETIYTSFNFAKPWAEVRYDDAKTPAASVEDLRVLAALEGGKPKPLFPRIV